jgi:DNA end-binding protein Ku
VAAEVTTLRWRAHRLTIRSDAVLSFIGLRPMAAIWKGALSFGLVNIPVRLHSAVRAGNGEIHFRQLHAKDLAPIKLERICTGDGEVVPWSEIVKGYEYTRGKYVALTDADMKAAALESSKAIEMIDFVREQEIDPRFFQTPYYLVPDKGGERAYALLREAVRSTGMVGIGKFTLRQKQQLASVKAIGDALVLEVMRFAGELVDPSEYTFPSADGVRPQELAMAEQLIGNLVQPFDASKYTDDYRESLMRTIRAKLKGKKIVADENGEPEHTKVIDLMTRLQESLAQAKGPHESRPRTGSRGRTRGGTRRGVRTARARRTA